MFAGPSTEENANVGARCLHDGDRSYHSTGGGSLHDRGKATLALRPVMRVQGGPDGYVVNIMTRVQSPMRATSTTNGAKRGGVAWIDAAACIAAAGVAGVLVATPIHPRGVSGGRLEEAET